MITKIRVYGRQDVARNQILRNARTIGIEGLSNCRIGRLYFLSDHLKDTANADPPLSTEQIRKLCAFLLADPVTEIAEWEAISDAEPQLLNEQLSAKEYVIEVAYRPGVTDVPARELAKAMKQIGLPAAQVATGTRYELEGDLSNADLDLLARKLFCNETIERYALTQIDPHFDAEHAAVAEPGRFVESVALLDATDDELIEMSRTRLLSLNLDEMQTIQSFYRREKREPTDVELETLAQTWSEHCVHKTFKAHITLTQTNSDGRTSTQEVDGLFQQYIRGATLKVLENPDKAAWVQSVFVDDAGIVSFDNQYDIAFKVETHNHPSALEPFGGANTGVGGVVRDVIGVSARPIATTDVLCFGPQDYPHAELPDGVLHPKRVADGVVAGIADYGNKLGLPTVNGAVIYDKGYLGNPLVFCGCVGLIPKGSHPTEAQPGDLVVSIGGRTGRDGLHGATFSSAELSQEVNESEGSAVQIGDPITEKGVLELVEAARDEQLYTAITDCGAGGFSSAVGEMGEELGVEVELTNAPLKYAGLTPWEIWLSEAQERMVLAVPPTKLARFQELADLWDVELSVLGHFTGAGDLVVKYDGRTVGELSMEFLHNGLPQRRMTAEWTPPAPPNEPPPEIANHNTTLLALLSHPSVASKETILRQYDHEVRGGTLVRPLVGPEMDGPSDAALMKPLGTWHHNRAFALSNGINPLLGKLDPYAMAVSAIDEAFRNAVAVGADPDHIAILDNFCWGNPTLADRLGALTLTCQGCYDAAVAYGAPFISGKDSLFNEFEGEPIPGTLLVSALGIVPDYEHRATSNLKRAGNLLFLVGETKAELGGSLLYDYFDYAGGTAPTMPANPLLRYRRIHDAIGQGLVQSCHDLSEGGLAVAVAEMAMAGRLGATVELHSSHVSDLSATEILYGESNGRLLIEVQEDDSAQFRTLFDGITIAELGRVNDEKTLIISSEGNTILNVSVPEIVAAWKGLPPATSRQQRATTTP